MTASPPHGAPLTWGAADEGLAQRVKALNRRAVVCSQVGDFAGATRLLAKAAQLTADRRAPGDRPTWLTLKAATFNNWGCLDQRQGRNPSALSRLQRAKCLELAAGISSPSTSINLCAVLHALGRYEEAAAEARVAIGLLQSWRCVEEGDAKVEDGADAETDTCHLLSIGWHNLALALHHAGDDGAMAREAHLMAAQLAQMHLPEGHPMRCAIETACLAGLQTAPSPKAPRIEVPEAQARASERVRSFRRLHGGAGGSLPGWRPRCPEPPGGPPAEGPRPRPGAGARPPPTSARRMVGYQRRLWPTGLQSSAEPSSPPSPALKSAAVHALQVMTHSRLSPVVLPVDPTTTLPVPPSPSGC
eukprot:EG_transcript_16049